jgi:hypothetical protein
VSPAVEDIAGLLGGKEKGACVDLTQRQQIEFEGSNDSEASAAATQRPEQIRFIAGVDADLLPRCGDELDGGYPVTCEAVLTSIEADATTKRVTGDADGRARAMEGGEAEIGRRRYELAPECAGADPRSARVAVDLDAA